MAQPVEPRVAEDNSARTLIVLNPTAGQSDPERVRRQIGGAFAVRGAAFELVETTCGEDAERLAREGVRLGYRAVVAAGGDGTLAEVLTGLAGTDVPLGIIPQGTANLVASNLGIPADIEGAVDIIVNGSSIPMDVGQMEDGRYFALIAGAGWDAEVMKTATRELKDRLGFGAYLFAALRNVAAPPTSIFRIQADDQEFEIRAATVLVANVGQIFHAMLPVEFKLAPSTSVSDGMLDICIFAPKSFSDVAAVLWKVVSQKYVGDQRMIYLKARSIRIDAEPPMIVQVDGDVTGMTPLIAKAVPGGVNVLVAHQPDRPSRTGRALRGQTGAPVESADEGR